MGKIIVILIGFLVMLAGVICIYDARILTKKWFSFGDQNEGSMGLKMVGFLIFIVGALVVFFNM